LRPLAPFLFSSFIPSANLARRRVLPYSEPHRSTFHTEQEAKLAQSAAQQGRNPDELVRQVVARYFDEESRFVDAVRRGEEEALRKFLEITSVLHGKSGFWSPTA
jgi:hypothetical protein